MQYVGRSFVYRRIIKGDPPHRPSFRRRQMCVCLNGQKFHFQVSLDLGILARASVQLLRNFPPVEAINKEVTSLEKPINQRDCIATYCPYWKIIYRREREREKNAIFTWKREAKLCRWKIEEGNFVYSSWRTTRRDLALSPSTNSARF